MAKRFNRVLISEGAARDFAYRQRLTGSDHADLSGDCISPVIRPFTGLRDKRLAWLRMLSVETEWPGTDYAPGHGWIGDATSSVLSDHGVVRHVDVAVRCRKCPNCLRARAGLWRIRASREIEAASRTWFGTLTLNPDAHFRCVAKAAQALAAQGLSWDRLDPDDAFKERCKPLTHECQLWVKRLRKRAEGLRYCLVVERHKSGLPHVHVLVHETREAIRHRQLSDAWSWGFVKFNLVRDEEGPQAARYVAKYLSKSAATRVKASLRYGAEDRAPRLQRPCQLHSF